MNIWQITTIVFAGLFLLSVFNAFSIGGSASKITGNAIGYLNDNVLGPQGVEAVVINSEKINGVIKATVNIDGQLSELYISEDGELLFPSAMPLTGEDTYEPQQPSSGVLEVSAVNGISLGPEDAEITVTEFSDFQCPYCALASGLPSWVEDYESKYSDLIGSAKKVQDLAKEGKIKFVYVPMNFLGKESTYAVQAALCADNQGKFWEMHDAIFIANDNSENNGDFSKEGMKAIAGSISEINSAEFNNCLDNDLTLQEANNVNKAANDAGVTGTPSFFVNGVKVSASWSALSATIGV